MTAELALTVALVVVALMQVRTLRNQGVAAEVARDTRTTASTAAADARSAAAEAAAAAGVARAILDRIEVLGGKNNRVAHRIEDAAGVVADDLAAAHERADGVVSNEPGAAADAAATLDRP